MSVMDALFDTIVVGAGVEGSATAYSLTKHGQRTLLLEQFPLPHSRGSSHGQTRITRRIYGDSEGYTKMMLDAYKLLEQLENETGTMLYRNTGVLSTSLVQNNSFKESKRILQKYNVPFRHLNTSELVKEYPMLSFEDNMEAILDESGGVLYADKILQAFQKQFVSLGGCIRDQERLLDVFPGEVVTVKTDKGTYRCRSLVLTMGPWSKKFLPSIGLTVPLKVLRVDVLYWKEKTPSEYGAGKFPVYRHARAVDGHGTFGLPSMEYPGLYKLCLHHGTEVDPERRDEEDGSWVVKAMSTYVSKHFPGLEPKPSIVEPCLYTNTPDGDLVLDRHPTWKNVIVGAGFSGHGFKLAPVVGNILADLAMGQEPKYDISPFRIDRFRNQSKL